MTRHLTGRAWLPIIALGLSAGAGGCALRPLRLPAGPGTPVPDPAGILDEATADCRGVRTLQAELAVSGRAGREKLRGRVIAGFERPSSMRLEAVAPFGPPVFILISRAGSATLLMPRDLRILADAPPASVIEALTGVPVSPEDLMTILTGCVTPDVTPLAARTYADGWAAVDMTDGAVIYLRRRTRGWRIAAGTRGMLGVEYGESQGMWPASVRLRVAGANGTMTADLTIALSQIETNGSIDPRAFSLRVPEKAEPLTLDDVRRMGPLGERR